MGMSEVTTSADRVILVAVKHVPVGGAGLRIEEDRLTRDGVSHGLDPINEVALEWALRARETGRADRVIAMTLGPAEATESLRKALSMGADEAVLVTDDALAGADVRTTARVLAAVSARVGAVVLLTGYESMDGSSGAVPAAAAAILDWPLASRLAGGEMTDTSVLGERDLGAGPETVEVPLPAVLSLVEGEIVPRYPKLRDVLRTKNAQATSYSAEDLGVVVAADGETALRLVAVPQAPKEPRVVGLEEGVLELFETLTAGSSHD